MIQIAWKCETIFCLYEETSLVYWLLELMIQVQILGEAVYAVSKVKVKLATLVEGHLKAPSSSATTLRYRGGCYSIPWIAPLYPWSLPYNAEC